MMDLSNDVQNIRKSLEALIKEATQSKSTHCLPLETPSSNMIDEVIDVNNIHYANDENWLYESHVKNSTITDLKRWLYQDTTALKDFDFHSNRLTLIRELARIDTKKNIDSRTFTRPKKRFNRPSIENYDEYFKNAAVVHEPISDHSISDEVETTKIFQLKSCASDIDVRDKVAIAQQAPLNFDFSQPTTSGIFEKIVATAPMDDSFQNMSPPSLINSMCSSTFTNLMENSMIKNDPLLREISVTDYTEAMLQDYDPPLFKSITDSCSSINLDNPESFIKQNADSTLNNVYKKNVSGCTDRSFNNMYVTDKGDATFLRDTFLKESSSDVSSTDVCLNDTIILVSDDKNKSTVANKSHNFNGTYKKSLNSKLNETFQKTPLYHSNDNLTNTTYANDSNKFNSTKRHSYIVDTRNDLNQTISFKQNSFGSVGSTDSLDYLSSLSSGSRDSNKMLNMADVDALVLQQEQSLHVMSTPKPYIKVNTKFWGNGISPVPPLSKGDASDSDSRSSNDDYRTVRSNISSSGDGPSDSISSDPVNSATQNLSPKIVNPKSLNMVESKPISNNRMPDIRSSYSNLKTVGTSLKGSYTNLKPIGANFKSTSSISTLDNKKSNLKTMSANLKGSYTQLKPVLLNLPCTDSTLKLYNPNTAMKRPNSTIYKSQSAVKIAEVSPTLRDLCLKDQVKPVPGNEVAKPLSKASGLPRPVSSIPRPATSKIPGPRSRTTNNIRQLSRPSSKNNLDYDF